MIVLIGSRKGGVGKSTIATNTVVELALSQRNVVLVDADPQATATNWALDRKEVGFEPLIPHQQVYTDTSNVLTDLDEQYDYVVVDSAGRDSEGLRAALVVSDVLIVPLRPSQADLDTLTHLVDVIEQAQDLNKNLDVRALITMASTNPNVREVGEAGEYLDTFSSIKPMNTVIRDRKIYRDALAAGRGVGELGNAKARQEVHQFTKELFDD